MSIKAETPQHSISTRGSENPLVIFITAFSAAVCLSLAFGLIVAAFAVAAGGLFDLGDIYFWITGGANAVLTLWLFVWTFVRALHVERRLRAGEDIDQPTFSIFGNMGRGTPAASQE